MVHHASLRRAIVASVLAVACGPGTGGSSEDGSSTSDGSTGSETTRASLTASTTESPSTGVDEGSTTSTPEPVEYVGFWDTGFGYAYFTACGEREAWLIDGVLGYELCSPAPLYLRVLGVQRPPAEAGSSPRLQVVEILEGPCTGGSCDGSVELGECASFEALCENPAYFECDILAQDCPAGRKCMPWANDGGMEWNATHCTRVVAMPVQHGDPCVVEGNGYSGFDDCELGVMCWEVDPVTDAGVCAALCDLTLMPDPVCPGGTICTPFFAMAPGPAGVCAAE
jgi:hypothetical protein